MSLAGVRGRMLARHGRTVTLTKVNPLVTASVTGKLHGYRPEELIGGVQNGDQRLEIGIVPSVFGVPARGDRVTVDGRTWQVIGATPRHAGHSLVGYSLWLRGG